MPVRPPLRLSRSILVHAVCLLAFGLLTAEGTGATQLSVDPVNVAWEPAGDATGYDLLRGSVIALHASSGDFGPGSDECLGIGIPEISRPHVFVPAPGEVAWYLVRKVTAGGAESWSSGGATESGDRDGGIQTSPARCVPDSDGDGLLDDEDGCVSDPGKSDPGVCGCGVPDTDTDGDAAADCLDADDDNDGVADGSDPAPLSPSICGDTDADLCDDCAIGVDGFGPLADGDPAADGPDSDGDGACDAGDACASDPAKVDPGVCGCGIADTDFDGDGPANCIDNCPGLPNPGQENADGDLSGDLCDPCPADAADMCGSGLARLTWVDKLAGTIAASDADGGNQVTLVAGRTNPLDVTVAGDSIYWPEGGSVVRADLDGGNITTLISGLQVPRGMAIDLDAGRLYIAVLGKIVTAALDGTGLADLVTGLDTPVAIQVDPLGGHIYWTDVQAQAIQRAALADGSGVTTLVDGAVTEGPGALALDLVHGRLYWARQGGDLALRGIQAAALDGSGAATVLIVDDPQGVAVDPLGGKLYWTAQGTTNTVQRSNLDGSGLESLVTGLLAPGGMDIDSCLADPFKTGPGVCGCGYPDIDADGDGFAACLETDDDNDGIPNGSDPDPFDPAVCGDSDLDTCDDCAIGSDGFGTLPDANPLDDGPDADMDGICDAGDLCPADPAKADPGVCGCGTPDDDTDGDGAADCVDVCPADPADLCLADPVRLYWVDKLAGTIEAADGDGGNPAVLVSGRSNPLSVTVAGDHLYWPEGSSVFRSDLVGGGIVELMSGLSVPRGVAVDLAGGQIYVAVAGKIVRAALDGTGGADFVTGLGTPVSIELDSLAGLITWTDASAHAVQQAALADGSGVTTLVDGSVTEGPAGLSLDLASGAMYWTRQGGDLALRGIQSGGLDGSGAGTLVLADDPQGVAVDPAGGALYWTAQGSTLAIQRSATDGTGVWDIVTGLQAPGGLDIDACLSDPLKTDPGVCGCGAPEVPGCGAGAVKAYWVEKTAGRIRRSDPDGGNVEDVITGLSGALSLRVAGGKVYWSEGSSIRRADLDGSNPVTLVGSLSVPRAVAVDVGGGFIYYSVAGKIQRAGLDGSNPTDLITGLTTPFEIELDVAGGKIYFTHFPDSTIQRANLADGSGLETLVDGSQTEGPLGLSLDLAAGKMYWTRQGGDTATRGLQRAELDGSSLETLLLVGDPQGIAVDPAAGKLYWVDQAADVLQRSDLDGSNVETLVTGLAEPGGMDLQTP